MKNPWQRLASKNVRIQHTKNEVLLPVQTKLLKHYTKPGKAFDDGCGWGEFADYLTRLGYTVTAHDPAPAMVKEARTRFQRPTFLTSSELRKRERVLTGQFDLVSSNLVLCILSEPEQRRVLCRLKRLLKPDGILLISFCHPCFDTDRSGLVSTRKTPKHTRYDQTFVYEKRIRENGMVFPDIHRPLTHFFRLFTNANLVIIDGAESLTTGSSYHPDFITLVLKKRDTN
ncbi:MAG: class I SAM-dependent methyltransferase [Candidatus Uhrbacteria bacterium]